MIKEILFDNCIKELVIKRHVHKQIVRSEYKPIFLKNLKLFNRAILNKYEEYGILYKRESIVSAKNRYATSVSVMRAADELSEEIFVDNKDNILKLKNPISDINGSVEFLFKYWYIYSLWDIDEYLYVTYKDSLIKECHIQADGIFISFDPDKINYQINLIKNSICNETGYFGIYENLFDISTWNLTIARDIKEFMFFFNIPASVLNDHIRIKNSLNRFKNRPNKITDKEINTVISIFRDYLNVPINKSFVFTTLISDIGLKEPIIPKTTVPEESLDFKENTKESSCVKRKQIFDEKFFDDYPMFTALRCLYDDVAVTEKEKGFVVKMMAEYLAIK
jgi:hypothetical protein